MRKWLFPAVLLLAGCDVMNGPDLRAKAQQDVQLARASEYHLTIAADAGGSTVPSGSLIAKEGFSVDIEGTAQPETVLVGWKQTAGAGKVKFTPVTTTKMNVAVSGGDATIAPVYLSRPSVLYMLPGGNTVAKNVSVRIVFDQNVDHAGAASLVALKDQNSTPVAFDDKSVAHSNSIVLKPQANLANYGTYIIYALAGIPLDVDFNSSFFDGVTFLNQTVTSRSQTANSFTTGSQIDNTPPTSSSFSIASLTGDPVYTAGVNVNLKSIDATDDSGPGGVDRMQIYNTTIHNVSNLAGVPVTAAINSGTFSLAFTSGMNYAWSLGTAIEGKYTVSALFQDQSLNAQAYVAYPGAGYTAYRDIYLDLTAPTVSTLTLDYKTGATVSYYNSGNSKTYISGLTASYTMTAADPNLTNVPSTFKGSGESSDGTNSVERKQYQLSNDGVNYSAWMPYTATGTLTLAAGADGPRTVSVKVADGVGNASSAFTATTQLVVDTTAPSVTIAGANGTLYTTTGSLPLSVTSTETGSGLNTYALTNPTDARAPAFVSDGTATTYGGTSGSPYTITAAVKTGTPGARSFDVKIADKVGNTTIVPINAVYDNVAPVPNLAANPFVQSVTLAKPTNSSNLTVNMAPSDVDSGMAYVYWAIVNGDVAVSGASPASLGATKVSVPASGAYTMPVSWTPASISETKTLFLWFEDKAGNLTAQTRPTQRINYSNDAPLGTVVIPSPLVPKNGSFTVTWSGTATSINITKAELSNDGSAWRNVSSGTYTTGIGTTSITSVGPLTFDPTEPKYGGSTTNGARLVYLRLTGSNGNTSVVTASYTYDNTPPYVTNFAVTGSGGTVTTNNATVTVSFWLWDNITAWAAGSGVTNTYEFSINGGAYSAPVSETTYANSVSYVLTGVSNNSVATVSMRGTDQAGNTTIVTQDILYDIVAPIGGTMTSPGTVSDRVVSITGNPTDGESGVDQVETWSDGNYSGWRAYSASVAFLLTPQNGTKTLYVHYKDKAGNVSGWVGPTYVTLNSDYSNLYNTATNWGNIVGANYADPTNRAAVQNTSYISLTSLNMTTGLKGPRSYVYKTNSGQYGWFDYYLSGTTIQFYYQTFNASGVPYVTNWTYGSISLPAANDYVYIDLDNATWSAVKNTFPGSPTNYDFYIQNQAGVLNLVRYQPMLLAPF